MARPAGFHEPDILTRSMLLFWQQGFEATSVRDLERATGLKASSLYNRFESKEKLFARVLAHYIDRVVARRIQRYLTTAADPVAGLRRFFETTYDYIEDGRPPMACLLTNTALEKAAHDPQVRQQLDQGTALLRDAFESTLLRARDRHQLPGQFNCQQGAQLLLLGMQGLLVDSTIHPDRAWLSDQLEAIFSALPLTEQGEQA